MFERECWRTNSTKKQQDEGQSISAQKFSTAPCPKHVFLKYFSIKTELLDADITADLGSKFCIENI